MVDEEETEDLQRQQQPLSSSSLQQQSYREDVLNYREDDVNVDGNHTLGDI